ncbi:hypothetical protein C8R44DRAFT_825733 [Mycena epipterygia]|nr:hypothetical protein C8R44DRAFT_825733 [Mycena epipterygia]
MSRACSPAVVRGAALILAWRGVFACGTWRTYFAFFLPTYWSAALWLSGGLGWMSIACSPAVVCVGGFWWAAARTFGRGRLRRELRGCFLGRCGEGLWYRVATFVWRRFEAGRLTPLGSQMILVDTFPACGLGVSVATDGTLDQPEVCSSRSPATTAHGHSSSRSSSSGHSSPPQYVKIFHIYWSHKTSMMYV